MVKQLNGQRIFLFVFFVVAIAASIDLMAQQDSSVLFDFNTNRIQHQKNAMFVLGSWAIGNIAVGGILQSNTVGTQKYFHQMNAGWNLVNLGIAAIGYWGVQSIQPGDFSLQESLSEYRKFQKLLLFNSGLDLAYMAGGLYLIERSRRPSVNNPERLKGFGQSIILQGGFLFAFDLLAYWTSVPLSKELMPAIQLAPQGGLQLGLHLTF